MAAGDTLALERRYGPGSHNVRCQALDSRSALSRWSDPAPLAVSDGPPFPDSIIAILDFRSEGQAAMVSDGSIAFAATDAGLAVVRLSDGAVLRTRPLTACFGVALSSDGSLLYLSAGDWLLKCRTDDLSTVDSLHLPSSELLHICISPDGQRLYVASETRECIMVLQTGQLALIDSVPLEGAAYTLALSHDGMTLYAGGYLDCGIAIIDTRALRVGSDFGEFDGCIYDLTLDPTDSFLYACEYGDWSFATWTIPTGDPSMRERLSLAGYSTCVTTDGAYLYIGGEEAIYILRRQDSRLTKLLPLPFHHEVYRMLPSPDGSRVLALGHPQSRLLGPRQQQ